jgi:hypothetical protein
MRSGASLRGLRASLGGSVEFDLSFQTGSVYLLLLEDVVTLVFFC